MNVKRIRVIWLVAAAMVALSAVAQTGVLPREVPEAEGVESRAIGAMIDSLMKIPDTEIHHVMVVRHGKVVAEMHPSPFKAEYGHTLFSCSKTFVALAVGIAIDENRLRLTDRVASFFPEKLPASISAQLARMTVRDLLTMSSGIEPDWTLRDRGDDWIKAYLARQVSEPGKTFKYDSMCTFMLSAIVQKVTGTTTASYLNSRLFAPMGITSYDWEESPDGISTGGWGLRLQAESLAKAGLLILNRGKWHDVPLVSEKWIAQMTDFQIATAQNAAGAKPTDGNQGYCYQMWRCQYPGAVRADGAFGQFIVVVPDKDLVVVIEGNSVGNGGKELMPIWNVLLPGVRDFPLKPGKDYARLRARCASARLAINAGKRTSPMRQSLLGHTIALAANRHGFTALRIDALGTGYQLTVTGNSGTVEIPLGYGDWSYRQAGAEPPYSITARSRFKGLKPDFVVAGNYAWTSSRCFQATAYYVNWISKRTFKIVLNEDGSVAVTVRENFSKDSVEDIHGTLQ